MADHCSDSNDSDIVPPNVQLNMADLKREEHILLSIYSKMAEQLHRLEVEELELRQKIRKKDMDQTISLMSPNPVMPSDDMDDDDALALINPEAQQRKSCSYYPNKIAQVSKSHNEIEDFINSMVAEELDAELPELTLSPKTKRPSLAGLPMSPRKIPKRSNKNDAGILAMRQTRKVEFITNKPAVDLPIDIDLSLAPQVYSLIEEEDD